MRAWKIAAALLLAASGAAAQEPAGSASGRYVTEAGTRIELRHARAIFVDEASSGHPELGEFRVLLTDRPVGPEALEESGTGSARDLAERGELLGVLITFKTRERDSIGFVELERPHDEFGVNTRNLSGFPDLWRRLDARPHHVAGELRLDPATDSSGLLPEASLSFDTAVDYDPVVRVLTGAEARDSAPARAALALHQAIAAGDLETARSLSTRAVAARMTQPPTDAERAMIGNMAEALREPARVVVRERSAVVVMGGDGLTLSVRLALEDGQWHVAD